MSIYFTATFKVRTPGGIIDDKPKIYQDLLVEALAAGLSAESLAVNRNDLIEMIRTIQVRSATAEEAKELFCYPRKGG